MGSSVAQINYRHRYMIIEFLAFLLGANMQKIVLIIFCSFSLLGCSTYVTFIPAFKIQSRDSLHLDKKVFFSVCDGRTSAEQDATSAIQNIFLLAYKNSLTSNDYFGKMEKGNVYIKMRIVKLESNFNSSIFFNANVSYQNTLQNSALYGHFNNQVTDFMGEQTKAIYSTGVSGTGRWYGAVWVDFELYDLRNNNISIVMPITAYVDEFNIWGYKTAKNVQERAMNDAISKFSRFLDMALITISNDSSTY